MMIMMLAREPEKNIIIRPSEEDLRWSKGFFE